ncbi:hypothetical protein Emed_004414 [Eimeria media]
MQHYPHARIVAPLNSTIHIPLHLRMLLLFCCCCFCCRCCSCCCCCFCCCCCSKSQNGGTYRHEAGEETTPLKAAAAEAAAEAAAAGGSSLPLSVVEAAAALKCMGPPVLQQQEAAASLLQQRHSLFGSGRRKGGGDTRRKCYLKRMLAAAATAAAAAAAGEKLGSSILLLLLLLQINAASELRLCLCCCRLQQLLTPGSSSSVLELLPPDTRGVWQSLAAAGAAAAAKHARAGDPPEVQQEKALQRMQQLLGAAAEGQHVFLDSQGGEAAGGPLLLNRILPQVLASRPLPGEKDFEEEQRVLLGSAAEAARDGSRCTNKDKTLLALVLKEPEPSDPAAAAGAAAAAGGLMASDLPSSMSDDARVHWRWHQRRMQQLKGRMRRRVWGFGAAAKTEPRENAEEEDDEADTHNPATASDATPPFVLLAAHLLKAACTAAAAAAAASGEVVVVGKLAAEGGRRLSWATAILEPLDGSAPLQLLQLQQTLQQQQQLQDSYGQQVLLVSAFCCGLPLPRPLQQISLQMGPGLLLLDGLHTGGRRLSAAAQQQQQQQPLEDLRLLYKEQNVHVLFASCSFLEPSANGGWVLRRSAFNGLLAAIREHLPHVVVLFGPIVSWLNLQQPSAAAASNSSSSGGDAATAASLRCAPLLQLPDLRAAQAEFFKRLAAAVQGMRVRVLLVPSTRDPLHAEPLPQPASCWTAEKRMQQQQQLPSNIHCVSNPCTLQVNDVRLLLTSADPLADIAADILCCSSSSSSSQQAPQTDCMQQVFRALLRQRTLFPRGASPSVPLDASRMQPLLFDTADAPHVVVCPSAGLPQQQHEPSSSSSSSSSAFACAVDGRVLVSPFNPRTRLGDAFDFTSLYIQPPRLTEPQVSAEPPAAAAPAAAAAAFGGDMNLSERLTIKYSIRKPRGKGPQLQSLLVS